MVSLSNHIAKNYISSLPCEILNYIFKYIETEEDVYKVSLCCKEFYLLIHQENLNENSIINKYLKHLKRYINIENNGLLNDELNINNINYIRTLSSLNNKDPILFDENLKNIEIFKSDYQYGFYNYGHGPIISSLKLENLKDNKFRYNYNIAYISNDDINDDDKRIKIWKQPNIIDINNNQFISKYNEESLEIYFKDDFIIGYVKNNWNSYVIRLIQSVKNYTNIWTFYDYENDDDNDFEISDINQIKNLLKIDNDKLFVYYKGKVTCFKSSRIIDLPEVDSSTSSIINSTFNETAVESNKLNDNINRTTDRNGHTNHNSNLQNTNIIEIDNVTVSAKSEKLWIQEIDTSTNNSYEHIYNYNQKNSISFESYKNYLFLGIFLNNCNSCSSIINHNNHNWICQFMVFDKKSGKLIRNLNSKATCSLRLASFKSNRNENENDNDNEIIGNFILEGIKEPFILKKIGDHLLFILKDNILIKSIPKLLDLISTPPSSSSSSLNSKLNSNLNSNSYISNLLSTSRSLKLKIPPSKLQSITISPSQNYIMLIYHTLTSNTPFTIIIDIEKGQISKNFQDFSLNINGMVVGWCIDGEGNTYCISEYWFEGAIQKLRNI